MSLTEQQNFTARLFTDESLRRDFLSEPRKIAFENGLSENDILQLKEILPAELDSFAQSLVYKRLREVEKFLPLTKKVLSEEFENLFRAFSKDFQPRTVKKHLEDAIKFTDFLTKKEFEKKWIKDLAKFEQSRLVFNGGGKFVVFTILNHDLREVLKSRNTLTPDFEIKKRKTFAVWLRLGRKPYHFVL